MLCDKNGITPYKFCKDTGTRTSTISTWKKKKSLASSKLTQKICDYFGVTMDYLMTGVEPGEIKKPELIPVQELDVAKKIAGIIGDINDKETSPLYFNGKKLDKKSMAILVRFHDLRHYAASIMHALNVPDQHIMQRGGWSSDKTLKQVYRGTINDFEQKYLDVTLNHFEIMQHELQHKNKKA